MTFARKQQNFFFAEWVGAVTPPEKVPIPTDIQPMLYCGAVSFASSADPTNTTIQNFLFEEYVRNRCERQRNLIVNALACDPSQDILKSLLDRAIDNRTENELDIGTHRLQLIQAIVKNSVGRQLVLDFVKSKQTPIIAIHGATAVANIISTIVPYLSSESLTDLREQVDDFVDELLSNPNLCSDVRPSLETSKSSLVANSDWMRYHFNDVNNWLSENIY